MRAYLVRLIKSKDLVGIYFARDIEQLMYLVDECTEVYACEYVSLPPGGIMWDSPAIPVPLEENDSKSENEGEWDFKKIPWSDACENESWWLTFRGLAPLRRWKPLCEGETPEPLPPRRTGRNLKLIVSNK